MNDKFQELGIEKYQKRTENIFGILMEKGNPKLAIQYAKRIIKEGRRKTLAEIASGTMIYKEELAKYLPEGIKDYF